MQASTVHDISRSADPTRDICHALPGPSDDAAWTAELVSALAGIGAPRSRQDLIDTYGTADLVWLREHFALADDVALAEQLAAAEQVAA